jgi:hypothetical protein
LVVSFKSLLFSKNTTSYFKISTHHSSPILFGRETTIFFYNHSEKYSIIFCISYSGKFLLPYSIDQLTITLQGAVLPRYRSFHFFYLGLQCCVAAFLLLLRVIMMDRSSVAPSAVLRYKNLLGQHTTSFIYIESTKKLNYSSPLLFLKILLANFIDMLKITLRVQLVSSHYNFLLLFYFWNRMLFFSVQNLPYTKIKCWVVRQRYLLQYLGKIPGSCVTSFIRKRIVQHPLTNNTPSFFTSSNQETYYCFLPQ